MKQPGDKSLFDDWCAGNQQAAQELFDRYVDRLVALARRRLNERMARRVDPEDIVQSVFRTFFARAREGRFAIEEQDDLCKLLYRLTVHKTLRQVHHHQAAKRNLNQEVVRGLDRVECGEPLDREPTPEAVTAFLDQMEHFLAQLQPQEREILEMRLHGFTTEEISARLGIYERKIYRIMERIRELAEKDELPS
jgi:RNA polymerase sigma-70 factor (ECF subfamily)